MNDMNPTYPPTAEAVDNHLSKSIDKLDQTTNDGFKRIEAQMREMATKDAVEAHVARLDLRVDHTNEKMDTGFEKFEREMAKGFAELKARDAERDADFEKREERRSSKQRWVLGYSMTGAGVVSGIVFGIISNLPT